jgi:DNA-binding transcriptional regulator/RsmH inhibitor MraZ
MEAQGGAAPAEGAPAAGATTATAEAAPAGSGLPVFGHVEFSGTYEGKLEPSGRLIIPAPFRYAFADGTAQLWAQANEHVAIYTRQGFNEALDAKLANVPAEMVDPMLRINIYSSAPKVPIDRQYRLVIPPAIRELVPLGEEIVFAGSVEFIRVMSRESGDDAAMKARMYDVMNQTWGGLPTKSV